MISVHITQNIERIKHASVEGYWNNVKWALLEATDRSCEWTKDPSRHRETWWWNDDVSDSVSEKHKLLKEWKQGNTSKE